MIPILSPIISVIGAITEASSMIIEKKIIRKHNIDYKNYTVYGFLALVLFMLPFMLFFWEIKPEAYSSANILIFTAVVISSIFANLFTYYSLKREKVCELEPIRLMQPLFTILLAFILSFFFSAYASERKYSILILAVIASVSLVLSHIKKHHLIFDKYIVAALFGSLFFAIELVISKSILQYYSSLTFYFLRCLSIFLLTLLIFRPKIKMKNKVKFMVLIAAILWVIYRTLLYYGYATYGIVFTTTLLILGPVFIFIFARIFLKEKITWRNIISAIIIVACIILAIMFEF
jgi:drug/metabolite transporter (DMT)-like permease